MFVACDESGIDRKNRFFVLGSAWVLKDHVSSFEKRISELRLRFKCWGEVKWAKVDHRMSEEFLRFYQEFLGAVSDMSVFFRFIVVDTKKLNERKVTEELQLKFMYLLISRNAVRGKLADLVNPSDLHILFDQFQESRQSRDAGWRKKTREYIQQYLKCEIDHFQPCDSHINSFVQLIDIMTGLVSEVRNGAGISSLSENKRRLSDFIFSKYEYGDTFEVWDWHPRLKV